MKAIARTDVGRRREVNEDDVLVESIAGARLLIVADGMGGHAAGDVASATATEEIHGYVQAALETGRTDYEPVLEEAIAAANEEIRALGEGDSARSGMGTTVVTAIVDNGEAVIANVGDSRAYHVHDRIEQVTVDHSLVQELVDAGELSPDEARDHPHRNVVSRSLGKSEAVEPDCFRIAIDGTLLLCSDGLTEEVTDRTIAETIADVPDFEAAAEKLVELANENGGRDNISVVALER